MNNKLGMRFKVVMGYKYLNPLHFRYAAGWQSIKLYVTDIGEVVRA